MIQLPEITISKEVLDKLEEYQTEIDKEVDFDVKAKFADKFFSSKNVDGNEAFDAIKIALDEMCSGPRCCVYCEYSLGCQVEHIRPKSTYPESCFDWNNYVYACGFCNLRKNNKFAVFEGTSHKILQITRKSLDNKNKGADVMINPRKENPLHFCRLDLKDKACRFVIPETLEERDKARAEYTFFTMLNLNDVPNENIRQARENAYSNYFCRLSYYANYKTELSRDRIDNIINGIKTESHPTVWKEMQRYYRENLLKEIDEDLHEFFQECPEALDW